MATVPDALAAIVVKAARLHTDPSKALDSAEKAVCKHDDFPEWTRGLIRQAILELIYDVRHRNNIAVRKSGGEFGASAKVDLSSGAVANALSRSPCLNYFIAGRTLGEVMGEEIEAILASVRETKDTAVFHERLLSRLKSTVPEGKAVADCYTERKLKALFSELNPKAKRKAA